MRDQQPAPLFVNGKVVGKQTKLRFEESGGAVGILGRETVSIAIDGASTGIPELPDILRGVAEDGAAPKEYVYGRDDGGKIAVVGLHPAEKDVAIDELRRLRHLANPHKSFRV
jgi:hypothetical protein